MSRRTPLTLCLIAGFLAFLSLPASAQTQASQSYIVVLKPSVASSGGVAADHAQRFGADVTHVYRYALNGYSARIPAAGVAGIANDPRVDYVEPDGVATLDTTQTPATWGLDRIDQRALPLDSSYTYDQTGAGVKAYIIDTGVRITHNEFGGRASVGVDEVGDGNGPDCKGGHVGNPSVSGHGTHVAGTVGGATYGVAKGVTIISVRVLDCTGSGSFSDVIAGIDWVTGDHQAGQPAVANMSLGGGAYQPVDDAVSNSIADGVSYAIAAGNSNGDACNYSPARTPAAMTIGATGNTDARASFSNWGNCVDWFAPGSSITSAWNNSNTATTTISGTSMATPHTAGVAALYLQTNPTASPATVRTALYDLTTKGIVTSSNSVNNHLLYSLIGATGSPTITSFNPGSGSAATLVTITGTNFTGATAVTFNFASASYTVVNSTTITATVPGGATSGHIRVTTPGGTATSAGNFLVTAGGVPTISGFSPPSGPAGTLVTITGTNFTGATAVTFNFASASYTVVNSTTITATVPGGATSGHVRVTTPGGPATSAGNFIVT